MKDSQDWLDKWFEKYDIQVWQRGATPEMAKSAIRKHILQEALGILEGVDIERPGGVKILDRSYYEMKAMLDDFLVMLRNKFNDKYKED